MSEVFGEKLAEIYDIIYSDKPYAEEVDFIESLIQKYNMGGKVKKVLDIGCGTGSHAYELVLMRGYDVVGIDASPHMIKKAIERRDSAGISEDNLKFFTTSAEEMSLPVLPGTFDAAVAMFNVMGYVNLCKVIKNVYKYLRFGGLFIFDFWNYSASGRAKTKTYKKCSIGERTVVREGIIEKRAGYFEIKYKFKVIHESGGEEEFEEFHKIDLLSEDKIRRCIRNKNMFQVVDLGAFMKPEIKLSKEVWDAYAVLQKLY